MSKQIELKSGTSLVGVLNGYGHAIRFHDDTGPLWAYRDAEGMRCVVTAETWEDAYDAAIDTLPAIDAEDVPEAYGFDGWCSGGYERVMETYSPETAKDRFEAAIDTAPRGEGPDLIEGYQYQSNASGTGIVSVSLNGESLDPLTPELLKALEWTLKVEAY
jgi:hypothetical protein